MNFGSNEQEIVDYLMQFTTKESKEARVTRNQNGHFGTYRYFCIVFLPRQTNLISVLSDISNRWGMTWSSSAFEALFSAA